MVWFRQAAVRADGGGVRQAPLTVRPDIVQDLPLVAVIEDDAAVREALGDLLAIGGYACRLYATAEQFLAGLGREPVACIVSDLRLPGIDGLALQRELVARGAAVPLLLITTAVTPHLAARARRAGVLAVLQKPVNDAVLLAQIEIARAGPGDARPWT
jgi:FixJ family two-component response regulator